MIKRKVLHRFWKISYKYDLELMKEAEVTEEDYEEIFNDDSKMEYEYDIDEEFRSDYVKITERLSNIFSQYVGAELDLALWRGEPLPEIFIHELETDEEFAIRVAQEQAVKERKKKEKEARVLANKKKQLEKLKKELGE